MRAILKENKAKLYIVGKVKGEGQSRNGVFFEIANKKITLS